MAFPSGTCLLAVSAFTGSNTIVYPNRLTHTLLRPPLNIDAMADTLQRAHTLDESLYPTDEKAMEFMKAQTGIQDEDELKKHVVAVQTQAYSIYPYSCIRRFTFVQFKLARLPAYQQFLDLGRTRKDPIFLDIGCCFGTDIRKAIVDGFPRERALGSDLQPEFWELGHKLYKSSPETFPVPFVPGDAFDTAFLEAIPPFSAPADTPVPDLSTLTSLNPLRGHISAIHASSFFHLFDEEKQFQLAKNVAGLLSAEPGSMILGAHGGRPEKGLRTEVAPNSRGLTMFCHSPESWTELWDGQVFPKGSVKVEAQLHKRDHDSRAHFLAWSVTRL